MELLRSSKSGLKKPNVSNSGSTTVERQKPIMERESIALVNPDKFSHLASEWRVLRYRSMMFPAFFIFLSKAGS